MIVVSLFLWSCTGAPVSPPEPETPVSIPSNQTPISEPIHISLPFNKPQQVPELGGTVTLIAGSRDTVMGADGRTTHEATVGKLAFVNGAEKSVVEFTSGKAFTHAGRNMAVYGMMALELVIAAPGKNPSP